MTMTPAEHYAEAERLLEHAKAQSVDMGEIVTRFDRPAEVEQLRINLFLHGQTLAAAQVHATLATASHGVTVHQHFPESSA